MCPSHCCVSANLCGVVAQPWTKIGQQRGTQEMVTFNEPLVGHLLQLAAAGRSPALPYIDSVANFRSAFAEGCSQLGPTQLGFRPYSLRRGGASYDFLAFGDISRTLWRGRWSGCAVGRVYVQEGVAIQTQMRISAEVERKLEEAMASVAAWLRACQNGTGGRIAALTA